MSDDMANVSLADPRVQACPYQAYEHMREQGPVYRDPLTGTYVVTSYKVLRQVLLDDETFRRQGKSKVVMNPEKQARIDEEFRTKGWIPGPSLGGYDEPEHARVRAVFNDWFRAKRMRELDPFVQQVAGELFDGFIDAGRCEWVSQFAVPLPMIVFCTQMGVEREELPKIKEWTDAWVKKLGMMLPEEEEMAAVEKQIAAQHYFQPIIERLRREPDGSLFSDLVNKEVPGWGRPLNDNELHGHLMADTFVGGSETTSNALAAGVLLLTRNPDVWRKLKSNPKKHMRTFVDEVLRLECPVQGLARIVARDTELGGVPIPAGSIVGTQYAAANRDREQFDEPEALNLSRKNAGSHLAFGSGAHFCLGAPLARRELHWGFTTLAERVEDMWIAEGETELSYEPNLFLRRLERLHIEFTPRRA